MRSTLGLAQNYWSQHRLRTLRDEPKVYRRHYQRRLEEDMTPQHVAMIIAAPVIVLIILWAPLLDFIGPPCVRLLQHRREQKASNGVTFSHATGI